MLIVKYLTTLGRYIMLMGRSFARPERMRMFLKQYAKEMSSLGVNSIGLVLFSSAPGRLGAYATAYIGHILPPDDLTLGLQHSFNAWFMWMSIIKSLFFAFIIASVSSFFGYSVEGGSVEVGKASTDAVVSSSVLILFSDVFLTQMLS